MVTPCFFAGRPGWGACDGPIDRCHLIPKQRIKRELRLAPSDVVRVVWDPRAWVPGCRWHHGQMDAYAVRLRREDLPAGTEEFAVEHGLVWSLERDYA